MNAFIFYFLQCDYMTSIGTYRSSVVCNKSCRTTIPKPVAKALRLEHKDKIDWELIADGEKVVAVVTKLH